MDTPTKTERHSGPSRARRAVITVVGAGLLFAGLVQGAVAVASSGPGYGFQTEAPSVRLVDEHGSAIGTSSHVMDVPGAYPDMPIQRFDLHLQNSGSHPAAFDLAATDLRSAGRRSLDGVLLVTVRDEATDRVLYRGRLSELAVSGSASVEPGSSANFRVEVEWADRGGDSNVYQGASLSFTITATSKELAA
jgi:hypothetical protein